MKLNEEYYIMTVCGLMKCYGKKLDDKFAIVYNWKDNSYSLTHTKSGLCAYKRNTLKDCNNNIEADKKAMLHWIQTHQKENERNINQFNYLLEYKIFNN